MAQLSKITLDGSAYNVLDAVEIENVITDFSLANAALVNKPIWTPTADGIFIGTIAVSYPANANGVRYVNVVNIDNTDPTRWSALGARQRVNAASSGETQLSATIAAKVESGMNIGARIYQNSGAAMTVKDLNIRGILIKK